MTPRDLITDHALVRYIERVQGLNLDNIREHMLTPNVLKGLALGASAIQQNNLRYVCKDGRIITVYDCKAGDNT